MDGYKQLNMVGAGFFSNEEPSFKARQLFFQQKLDTVLYLLGNAIGFDVWYNDRILCCGGAYVKTGLGG